MKKGRKVLGVFCLAIIFLVVFNFPCIAPAGQVVTDQIRNWAQKALEEERSLKGLEQENTISVLYFISRGEDPLLGPLQKGLAIMLITDLKKLEEFNVVDRVKLQALLEEMELSQSGLVDEETRLKLGKIMKARWIVGGELNMDEKKQLKILSQLLDTPESKILGKPEVEGLFQNLLKLEKDLLFKIVDLLKVKLTPKQKEILAQPVTLNLGALFSYFKGIEASDQGDYEKAADYYKEATKQDPDFELPKLALFELFDLKLVKGVSPKKKRKRSLAKTLRGSTSLTDTLVTEAPVKRLKRPKDVKPGEEKPVVEEPEQPVDEQPIGEPDMGNGAGNGAGPFGNGAAVGYP